MVGNSASEPDATGSQPLDAWTVATLLGGVESLCDHIGTLTESMLTRPVNPAWRWRIAPKRTTPAGNPISP